MTECGIFAMCSRGVYVPTNPDELNIVNAPSFLRVNSFVDDDKTIEGEFLMIENGYGVLFLEESALFTCRYTKFFL